MNTEANFLIWLLNFINTYAAGGGGGGGATRARRSYKRSDCVVYLLPFV